jgi:hypothetical protein
MLTTPSPSRGGSGWGWVFRSTCIHPPGKHPIPLPASPLKGEEVIFPAHRGLLYEREGTNTIKFSRLGRRTI